MELLFVKQHICVLAGSQCLFLKPVNFDIFLYQFKSFRTPVIHGRMYSHFACDPKSPYP